MLDHGPVKAGIGDVMTEFATCLWFDDAAEAAAALYTRLLGAEITGTDRPAPEAPPVLIHLDLGGQRVTLLNGGPGVAHGPAASLVAMAATQAESDAIWRGFLDAGAVPDRCGWLTDPWGVRWQVFPAGLRAALFGGPPEAAERAYHAMLAQVRIDLDEINHAREFAT